MKTAIALASVALLAGIANHGCESAAANQKPQVNRVLRVKDRGNFLKELALDFDAWIEQTHTMEERVKYLEDWASNVGWDLYDVHDGHTNIGSQFYELYDDFWDFVSDNDWDALRKKMNEAGFNVEKDCEYEWAQDYYGSWTQVEGDDCELIITLNDY